MPDGVSVTVKGAAELEDRLARLPIIAAKAIVKIALVAAGKIFLDEMKSRVRRGFHVFKSGKGKYKGQRIKGRSREYGVLSRAIGTQVVVASDGLGGMVKVGPRKKAFWALFLEFGAAGRAAYPFIRPAFETKKQAVLDQFLDTCREELNKAGLKVQ
jgi:HK97 gp10 family phage protein